MSTLTQLFTSIANSIREKKGTSSLISAEDFPTEILNIPTGGTNINLFVQDTEPETYYGIWIKSNDFTYDSIVETNSEINLKANSINILQGDFRETILIPNENSIYFSFNKIFLTDANNNVIEDIPIYYGDGQQWIQIIKDWIELEYIEATGTQYIDTGVVGDSDKTIEFTVERTSSTSRTIFGCWTTASSNENIMAEINQNKWGMYYKDLNTNCSRTLGDSDGKMTLYYYSTQMGIKNNAGTTLSSKNYSHTTWSSNINMYIGARNRGSSVDPSGYIKIYSCKIWNNGTLIRNFIPVKTSSNVVCLFDTVNSVFYYNSGTGSFVPGPEVQN